MEYFILIAIYSLFAACGVTDGMKCMQCTSLDNNGSTVDRHTQKDECLLGKVPATPCKNPDHTHCTTYYVKTVALENLIFIWRKCGIYNDTVHPCRSHTLDEDGNLDVASAVDEEMASASHRYQAESKKANIRICVFGCDTDGCDTNHGARNYFASVLVLIIFSIVSYLL